ncbi:hypothetical protein CC80DRAFT_510493 [Byssothecium circinans]|uniref:Uncharacterized protein n=1 Tax=Byssothecium circinans TaxID=147558 RepID=A0A6A5TA38_9PLEO|nr:hypothetical protein CC80DRAFT_510493 [Byssothecium circinans]
MRILLATVLTVLASTAFAVPTTDLKVFDKALDKIIVRRDNAEVCHDCTEHLDICMKYGNDMAPGIEHCADICNAYVCRKFPQCKEKCADKGFDNCQPKWA